MEQILFVNHSSLVSIKHFESSSHPVLLGAVHGLVHGDQVLPEGDLEPAVPGRPEGAEHLVADQPGVALGEDPGVEGEEGVFGEEASGGGREEDLVPLDDGGGGEAGAAGQRGELGGLQTLSAGHLTHVSLGSSQLKVFTASSLIQYGFQKRRSGRYD